MPDQDAAHIRGCILRLLPSVKSGTLRIWGDWFGRPYDNCHRVIEAAADEVSVTVGFDQGETLRVWRPVGFEIDATTFRIRGAERIRWEWFYYGRPPESQNRFFLDSTHRAGFIQGQSNVDWYSPAFQTDAVMPAIELV